MKVKVMLSNEMCVFEKYWEIGILCRNRSHRTFCIQFSIVLSSIYLDSFLKHNPFWTIALAVSISYAADVRVCIRVLISSIEKMCCKSKRSNDFNPKCLMAVISRKNSFHQLLSIDLFDIQK